MQPLDDDEEYYYTEMCSSMNGPAPRLPRPSNRYLSVVTLHLLLVPLVLVTCMEAATNYEHGNTEATNYDE